MPLATAINTAGEVVPLILTSIGVRPAHAGPAITIDATPPPTPTGLDLQDASDSFFSVTDATGTHVVGSNTDNYTNDTSPTLRPSAPSRPGPSSSRCSGTRVPVSSVTAPAGPASRRRSA